MSNKVLGQDCCGDRYECNTTKRCECGCERCYCQEWYKAHCVDLVEACRKTKKAAT
jgi:hypothetical protein